MTITRDNLRDAGRVLFGERWQTDMAEALGLGDSARIRQFMSGYRNIPDGIGKEIVDLLRARSEEAAKLADRIESKAIAAHSARLSR